MRTAYCVLVLAWLRKCLSGPTESVRRDHERVTLCHGERYAVPVFVRLDRVENTPQRITSMCSAGCPA